MARVERDGMSLRKCYEPRRLKQVRVGQGAKGAILDTYRPGRVHSRYRPGRTDTKKTILSHTRVACTGCAVYRDSVCGLGEFNILLRCGRTSGVAEQDLCSSCTDNPRISSRRSIRATKRATHLQCLMTLTRVISNV